MPKEDSQRSLRAERTTTRDHPDLVAAGARPARPLRSLAKRIDVRRSDVLHAGAEPQVQPYRVPVGHPHHDITSSRLRVPFVAHAVGRDGPLNPPHYGASGDLVSMLYA